MGKLIDTDRIIYHEIDEIGGEYEPYLGCSKSQIDNLPPVEVIPKAEYEVRLKADMVTMIDKIKAEIEKEADTSSSLHGISEIGLRKALKIIDKCKAESEG